MEKFFCPKWEVAKVLCNNFVKMKSWENIYYENWWDISNRSLDSNQVNVRSSVESRYVTQMIDRRGIHVKHDLDQRHLVIHDASDTGWWCNWNVKVIFLGRRSDRRWLVSWSMWTWGGARRPARPDGTGHHIDGPVAKLALCPASPVAAGSC